jgi:nucleoside-diphosphate-sugar epimerase/predicted dehydrogenase
LYQTANKAVLDEAVGELIILGGGAVVAEYYLPALAMMGRLGSVTVVEANPEAISVLRRCYPHACYEVAAYQTALSDRHANSQSSAVVVALPNALHVAASRRALEQGFHVLCEKPLALQAADCALLADLAASGQRCLKVAMSRRYLPSLMAAAELIGSVELGAPLRIEAIDCAPFSWRPQTFSFFEPAAGGILADIGVHYLDYLSTVVGPLEPVHYEDDSHGGVESALTYDLRAGDVPIQIRLSRMAGSSAELRIFCEKGTINVEKSEESQIFVSSARQGAKEWSSALQHPFSDRDWPLDFHGSFCEMLADFGRAILGRPSRTADVREAEATTRLIEWAYSRRRVSLPRKRPTGGGRGAEWLITGATGFIGGHLLDHLYHHEQGAIRALVRSPATCPNIARYPVEIAPADLLARDEVEKAVADTRIVFHLAYGRDGPDPSRVTVEGTKNVVNAAIAAGAEAIVVLSTMYVFGFPRNAEIVDESCPYRPYGGEYGRSKAKMEQWCLERARNSGSTRIVVLNPTCVFGPRGGAYTTLPVELARRGQFCWIDGGRGLCNYVYVSNLVDALLLAAENKEFNGGRFIVNDGWMSWREFFDPFLAGLAVDVPDYGRADLERLWRGGPSFSWRELARAIKNSQQVREVVKRSAVLRGAVAIANRHGLGSLSAPARAHPTSIGRARASGSDDRPPLWLVELFPADAVHFSAKRAQDDLGWRPRVNLDEARKKTLEWLRDAGFYDGAYA